MSDIITAYGVGRLATNDILGVHYPRIKITLGAAGVNDGDVSSANPIPVIDGYLPAGTNRSGTITAGGTAQQLAAANTTRRALYGQNISAADLWVNEVGGNAAVGAAGSYKVGPGEGFSISTNRAISIVGATTGQAFTAVEI